MPLVSVIIPAFNSARYIEQAIRSIAEQSFKDFEIIVVDDGSSDNTLQVVGKCASELPVNIRTLSQQNSGPAAARALAIRSADSKYIALMDSDDISWRKRLEFQINYLQESKLDVCGGAAFVFGATLPRVWAMPSVSSELLDLCLFNSPVLNPTAFGTTEAFLDSCVSSCSAPAEDYKIWTSLIMAGYKLGNVDKIVLSYRIHPTQISSASRKAQAAERTITAKRMWNFRFGVFPEISSFHKFVTYQDAENLAKHVVLAKSSGVSNVILKSQIWKMIMRSSLSKISLISIFRDNGIFLSNIQVASLFAAASIRYVGR